jgi:hypothetical protein
MRRRLRPWSHYLQSPEQSEQSRAEQRRAEHRKPKLLGDLAWKETAGGGDWTRLWAWRQRVTSTPGEGSMSEGKNAIQGKASLAGIQKVKKGPGRRSEDLGNGA